MRFLKLPAVTETRFSPNSPTQRFRFSAQTRKPQGSPFLTIFPRSFGSISCSLGAFPIRVLYQSKRIFRIDCFDESRDLTFKSFATSSDDDDLNPQKNDAATESNNSLSIPLGQEITATGFLRNAARIGGATAMSKGLGLLREIILAAVFGVGPVITAFKHASVLPSFASSLLGGVNGPIHVTMSTTLSKLPKERGKKLVQHTNSVMFLIGGVWGALIFVFAELIVYVSAPGLWTSVEGQITREVAISQLKLMTPCIILAGPIGIGFGRLSAEGDNLIPCISPALSNISLIASCFTCVFMRGSSTSCLNDTLFGGILVSCGASLGAFLQWLTQVIIHEKTGCNSSSISWPNILRDKDVHEFFALMLPATLSSGLAQIASFTDLYFASFIPGAAAGLSYAHLLAMAPLGMLESIIILPFLPTFSRLAKPLSWPSLMENLKRAVLLCIVIVLPITSTMCVLAEPVISVLFQRFTFDSAASALVSSLFLCYSIGSPFYIIRELLVTVFYALGDGKQPFLISMAAILMNAFLDWLFVSRFRLGAVGLALSTSFVTALSALLLLHLLLRKLQGEVDSVAPAGPLLLLLSCCIISGLITSVSYKILRHHVYSLSILRFCRLSEVLFIFLSGSLGMFGFFFPLIFLHFVGMKMVKDLFRTLINR